MRTYAAAKRGPLSFLMFTGRVLRLLKEHLHSKAFFSPSSSEPLGPWTIRNGSRNVVSKKGQVLSDGNKRRWEERAQSRVETVRCGDCVGAKRRSRWDNRTYKDCGGLDRGQRAYREELVRRALRSQR